MSFVPLGLWTNIALFALASAFVWLAGTRMTERLDAIAGITGMDRAFVGMLLLGGATSLPEIAAVSTASATGNAALATNNLLGSVAFNVMLIAVADAVIGRDALTAVVPSATTLLQGALSMIVLCLMAIAVLTGDVAIAGVGIWPTVLFVVCVAAFRLAAGYRERAPWKVSTGTPPAVVDTPKEADGPGPAPSLRRLIATAGVAAAVILVAGLVLSQSADAIAKQTGLGSGIVGLVLVAFATSLPEVSSITAAVRRKRYEMALGDVFGTNILTVGLVFLADLFYRDGPVLAQAGRFEAVAALLGLLLTGIFLVGLLERSDRTILHMGYDAATGVVVFVGGLVLLFFLQS
ncbi:sodium:calcium antiporter [Rhodoplanes sp. TEM]|uniref:Sodium:calcium antiporter n=1 Tax=Rhodoplanes tepidamans TaxID=200616 RepID=A0ABT5J7P6_RHOTP|nr:MULTISPECIES: sodium:calcium antiporter [Rhodoplanes]MDC7785045.1 sodium:calcium antiporter [Rhodoplanes tepidamans]MDC7982519.1 sodium:calcium antiporter [Rhodoplanes sp. TEM]MDQ0356533.1 cation:H+ antiporter [Rhodoplanes tepidamans]